MMPNTIFEVDLKWDVLSFEISYFTFKVVSDIKISKIKKKMEIALFDTNSLKCKAKNTTGFPSL